MMYNVQLFDVTTIRSYFIFLYRAIYFPIFSMIFRKNYMIYTVQLFDDDYLHRMH